MKGYIPYEKLSRKKQREIDRERRGTWGAINPVTRKPENPDAYNRKKENRRWKADEDGRSCGIFLPHECKRKFIWRDVFGYESVRGLVKAV